jgi:glycine cleavage system H protein
VNEGLGDQPELVNQDPYGEGWLVTLRASAPDELASLLDAAAYAQHCEESAS